jgi:hypothetical protein
MEKTRFCDDWWLGAWQTRGGWWAQFFPIE